jgi:WD40 repeat protein
MSPDGEAIVTGAGDETLRFWNVFSKARSQKVQKESSKAFVNKLPYFLFLNFRRPNQLSICSQAFGDLTSRSTNRSKLVTNQLCIWLFP